jgi:DNA-binding transcriptional LysR family regulator
MRLNQLRYFIVLAEELSFTAAARRLGMSQPPLSQQIQALEATLGTALFARSSRRVELTAAGAALLERARTILAQIDDTAQEIRAIGHGSSGMLSIATTGSVLLDRLASLIAFYRVHEPAVVIRLHEMAPQEQLQALQGQRVDLAVIRHPAPTPDLNAEMLWREKVVVALPEGHGLAAKARLQLSDLAGESHVFLRLHDSNYARYLRDCCIAAGFVPNIAQEVVEAYSLVSLVAAGLGVALVPEAVQTLTRKGVVYRPLKDAPAADVKMISRPEHNALVARFSELAHLFLEQQAAQTGA